MRNTELEPTQFEYTESDLEDLEYWPSVSNIRIVKNNVPPPSETARQREARAKRIKELELELAASDELLEPIKIQLSSAQRSKNEQAIVEAMNSYSEHLGYVKGLEIRIRILKEPMF